MDNEAQVKLTFTVNEINLILAGLGKLPAESVLSLINRIVADAQVQLPAAPAQEAEAA